MASGRIFCCSVFDLRKNSKFSRISTDLSAEKCYKWIVKEPRIGKVSPGPRKVSQKALFCNGISFSRGASRRAGKKVNNVVNILSRRLSGPSGSKCECFLGFSGLQSLGSLLCCVSKAILYLKGTCSSNGESGEVEENQNKCRRLEARKELQALELIETLDIPLVTSIICTRTFSWSSRTESGCTTSVTLQPKKMNLRVTSSKKFLLNLAIRLLRSESCEPPTYPCGKSRCNSCVALNVYSSTTCCELAESMKVLSRSRKTRPAQKQKISHFQRTKRDYTETKRRLLLLSGDTEENPGPGANTGGSVRGPRESTILVTSYNVRGLGDELKLRHLVNACYKKSQGPNPDRDLIFCFQETYINQRNKLPYLWRGNYHLTNGNGHKCGCLTLVSSHVNIVHKVDFEDRGHLLVCQRTGDLKAS